MSKSQESVEWIDVPVRVLEKRRGISMEYRHPRFEKTHKSEEKRKAAPNFQSRAEFATLPQIKKTGAGEGNRL